MTDRGHRKTITGVVVSDRMIKTVVVRAESLVKHPVFLKYIRRRVQYKAHDEGNLCRIGDRVMIVETRPLSKEKRWRVREIVEKAK